MPTIIRMGANISIIAVYLSKKHQDATILPVWPDRFFFVLLCSDFVFFAHVSCGHFFREVPCVPWLQNDPETNCRQCDKPQNLEPRNTRNFTEKTAPRPSKSDCGRSLLRAFCVFCVLSFGHNTDREEETRRVGLDGDRHRAGDGIEERDRFV